MCCTTPVAIIKLLFSRKTSLELNHDLLLTNNECVFRKHFYVLLVYRILGVLIERVFSSSVYTIREINKPPYIRVLSTVRVDFSVHCDLDK